MNKEFIKQIISKINSFNENGNFYFCLLNDFGEKILSDNYNFINSKVDLLYYQKYNLNFICSNKQKKIYYECDSIKNNIQINNFEIIARKDIFNDYRSIFR
jgi:hypothetical protein